MSVCKNCIHCVEEICLIYGYYIIHPEGTCDNFEEDVDD